MATQKQLNKELVQEIKEIKAELQKCKQNFEIEMNIKNGLYYFILTNDLVGLLKQFQQTNDYENEDYYIKCLEFLTDKLP